MRLCGNFDEEMSGGRFSVMRGAVVEESRVSVGKASS